MMYDGRLLDAVLLGELLSINYGDMPVTNKEQSIQRFIKGPPPCGSTDKVDLNEYKYMRHISIYDLVGLKERFSIKCRK